MLLVVWGHSGGVGCDLAVWCLDGEPHSVCNPTIRQENPTCRNQRFLDIGGYNMAVWTERIFAGVVMTGIRALRTRLRI